MMNILKNTTNTNLWLLESNNSCHKNLYDYAKKYNVERNRIKFAPKVALPRRSPKFVNIRFFKLSLIKIKDCDIANEVSLLEILSKLSNYYHIIIPVYYN